MSCTSCARCREARRREKIKRAFHILIPTKFRTSIKRSRTIKMPWHMNPEWLPSHERDNWIMNRDRALMTMGIKGKANLRHYQRGNFAMFPPGTTAVGAGGDCTFTQSTIPNLSDFSISPTDSFAHARLFSDGDWYGESGNTSSWGASDGTWQGGCAVADYDTRWVQNSGDTENGGNTVGSDGVWTAATTSASVGMEITGVNVFSGTFTLECRDGDSLNTLFTDGTILSVEVDPGC